jgi:fibronectin type 3 domain-containing protein
MRCRSKFRLLYLAVLAGSLAMLSACAGVSSSAKASSPATTVPSPASGPDSVALAWNPSSSSVVGYNLYRGTQSGGPYAKLNSSALSGTNYTDSNTESGTTYYYVSTAVNAANEESAYSNEASATIP